LDLSKVSEIRSLYTVFNSQLDLELTQKVFNAIATNNNKMSTKNICSFSQNLRRSIILLELDTLALLAEQKAIRQCIIVRVQ